MRLRPIMRVNSAPFVPCVALAALAVHACTGTTSQRRPASHAVNGISTPLRPDAAPPFAVDAASAAPVRTTDASIGATIRDPSTIASTPDFAAEWAWMQSRFPEIASFQPQDETSRGALLQSLLDLGDPPDFDGPVCSQEGCERRFGLQWDHIDPVVNGGPTTRDNLEPLCVPDHVAKTERDRANGLLRPRGAMARPP